MSPEFVIARIMAARRRDNAGEAFNIGKAWDCAPKQATQMKRLTDLIRFR
jgi:hypothetical protein